MVAARRVVARRDRRVVADEDRARVAYARRERHRVAEEDDMLRRDAVDLGERRLEIRPVDDAAHRPGSVLRLGGDLALGGLGIAAAPEHDEHLRRPRRKIDRDVARHEQLRLVHVRVPRPDDLVDRRDRIRAVRERGDRLRPADRPHLVDAEQLRRSGDEPRAGGRRDDDDPRDTRDLRRHGAHDERRDEPARHVDPDRFERNPAPLELDARLDLEPQIRGPLQLVPAADAVRERQERSRRQTRRRRRRRAPARRRRARPPSGAALRGRARAHPRRCARRRPRSESKP